MTHNYSVVQMEHDKQETLKHIKQLEALIKQGAALLKKLDKQSRRKKDNKNIIRGMIEEKIELAKEAKEDGLETLETIKEYAKQIFL